MKYDDLVAEAEQYRNYFPMPFSIETATQDRGRAAYLVNRLAAAIRDLQQHVPPDGWRVTREEVEKYLEEHLGSKPTKGTLDFYCDFVSHFAVRSLPAGTPRTECWTREAVEAHRGKWLVENPIPAGNGKNLDWGMALLSHFAPPTAPLPISGMSVEEIQNAMEDELNGGMPDVFICARVAHRLAHPAPVVDPDAEAQSCRNCQYFWPQDDYPNNGWCRAHPPVRVPREDTGWPNTQAKYWCGEWRAVAATKERGE